MKEFVSPAKRKKTRLWNIVYYLVAAVILAATMVCAFRGKDNYSSETFGTTVDSRQKLKEGMEIRVDFEITRDNFKGISLKFNTTSKVQYGNETLHFYLRDNTTGEIVSKYVLEMRKVLPQVGNFIPLAFEESEGKEVSLIISGRDIKVTPYLALSENSDQESELYVGNKRKTTYSLVFSTIYKDYRTVNFQALIKGVVYFFLWILVGIWPKAFRKALKTVDSEGNKGGAVSLMKLSGRYRVPLQFTLMTLVFLFLIVFVYFNNVKNTMGEIQDVDLVEKDSGFGDASLVMDSSDDILLLSFTAAEEKLSSASFEVSAEKKDRGALLHIQLFDEQNDVVWHDEYVRVSSLPSSRSVWKTYLNQEYTNSKGRRFRLRIEPLGFKSSVVHFYIGEAGSPVQSMMGGRKTGKLPVFSVSYADYGFLRTLYRYFAILIYLFLVMCFYMIVVRKWDVQKIYIPLCMYLGILYMLIIPVYSVPDEYAHIDTAYRLSNTLMGIGEPEGLRGYDYRREIDVETEEYYTYNATTDDYRRIYKEFFAPVPEQNLVTCVARSTDSNVSILYFLPSALGISFGRILRLSTIPLYLLGRLFNLAAYVMLTYIAVRKLSGLKEVFLLYASLPIGLQQAASLSYDCIVNAFSLLFFAYCVYFALDRGFPQAVNVFLLLVTSLQMVTVKGGVYFPLCFFLLLIPLERRWRWKKNALFFLLIGGFLCLGFMQGNIISLLNRLLPGTKTRVSMFSGKEIYTFGYLLHHPLSIVRLYGNTCFMEGSRLVYEFFGGKMGSVKNIQMPWLYPCLFMIIMAVSVNRSRKDFSLRRMSRVMCAVVSVLPVLLVGVAMILAHTPTDIYYITGLQGRYYIPIMMFPLLCLMNTDTAPDTASAGRTPDSSGKHTEICSGWNLLMWYCAVHCIFVLNIIMVVMPIETI